VSAVRGWCPDLFAPMPSGDGLLLRIKPRFGRLAAADAIALAKAAMRHGNGAIETTNRGNLQFRGFSEPSAVAFAEIAVSAGLASDGAALERRRNILVSPLAGDDPACAPPLTSSTADIALRRGDNDGVWRLEAGGYALACTANQAADLALRLAHAVDAETRFQGGVLFARAGLAGIATAPVPTVPPIPVGPLLQDRLFGVGTQPGQCDATLLRMLAELSLRLGDATLRITPWRAILIGGLAPNGRQAIATMLSERQIDPSDPRLRTAACIGAPGCGAATVPAPADAATLSACLPPGRFLHVSGCGKGCAHPGAADVTLVGRDGGYDLVRNGSAGDAPALRGLALDDVRALDLFRDRAA
jgi:precorrin-3B synthase